MCSRLNDEGSKNCSCKFAHLCRRNNKMEAVPENGQPELDKPTVINTLMYPMILFSLHDQQSQTFRG